MAVVPERLARWHAGRDAPLALVEPPFGEVALNEGYWFVPDRLADPARMNGSSPSSTGLARNFRSRRLASQG